VGVREGEQGHRGIVRCAARRPGRPQPCSPLTQPGATTAKLRAAVRRRGRPAALEAAAGELVQAMGMTVKTAQADPRSDPEDLGRFPGFDIVTGSKAVDLPEAI
jgi:hypothetical protein